MKNFGTYITNKEDNLIFKKISGDKNKIHFDKRACSKTHFGQPIVYAQLITINCLLKLKIKKILKNLNLLKSLYCKFNKPIFVGEKLFFDYKINNNLIFIEISSKIEIKANILINLTKRGIVKLKEKKYKFISNKSKLDSKELQKIKFLFLLSKKIGNYKNKNNIISNYEISFNEKNKKYEKFYEINKLNLVKWEKKFSNIHVRAYFFSYKINFSNQNLNFKSITVKNKKYDDKNFLVIGGSSGLGKIITEYLCYKKSNVTFTYNTNYISAKRLFNKLKINNKKLKFFQLNQKIIKKLKNKEKMYNYDYILFFATPKIFGGHKELFNFSKYENFNNIYIGFLNKIIEIFQTTNKKHTIFVPSTVLVKKNWLENPEYSISKMSLEKYINLINKRSKNVFIKVKRFDAFHSEQASHILGASKDYNKLINEVFS